MKIVNHEVVHKTFGKGTIIEQDNAILTVRFSCGEKRFQYPEAFRTFLQLSEDSLNMAVQEEICQLDRAKRDAITTQSSTPQAITKPQAPKRSRDERPNIAFKCNYCDGGSSDKSVGFNGACSDAVIYNNIDVEHRTWCCSEDCSCPRYLNGEITREELEEMCKDDGFICYNRTQHRDLCDGPSTYRAEKVDQVVDSILSGIFFRAKGVKESELLKRQITSTTTAYQKQLKAVKAEYVKSSKELSKWEGLMLDSIEGTCVFTPEQVKKRMDVVQQSVNDLSAKIEDLQNKATETAELTEEIKAEHQRLLSWAEVYDGASLEEKKMVASYLIKAVTISQNYGIRIDFNITEAQYLSGMEMM